MVFVSDAGGHQGKIIPALSYYAPKIAAALTPSNVGTALQLGSFAYDLYRDRRVWNREDTAYRRAVADMDLAGLNTFGGSVSAAGSSAAGASAFANYVANRQLAQRDREIDIQRDLANEQIRSSRQSSLGRTLGFNVSNFLSGKHLLTALELASYLIPAAGVGGAAVRGVRRGYRIGRTLGNLGRLGNG